jgi:aspartate-semialdehyde dehydrogenase
MDPDVPLVIPEINGDDAKRHRGIIANPNCTTAVALMAIYPLHRAFHVERVFAVSYQAGPAPLLNWNGKFTPLCKIGR